MKSLPGIAATNASTTIEPPAHKVPQFVRSADLVRWARVSGARLGATFVRAGPRSEVFRALRWKFI